MDFKHMKIFIQERFNKAVEVLRELPSYEDKNILFENSENKDELMVLKVLCERPKSKQSAFKKLLQARIKCVHHLITKRFTCSEFMTGKDDAYIQEFDLNVNDGREDEPSSFAVLFSFLPGKELEHTGYVHNADVVFKVGAFLGCAHKAFEDFDHSDSLFPDEDNAWHFSNYHLLAGDEYLDTIQIYRGLDLQQKLKEIQIVSSRSQDAAIRQTVLHLSKYIRVELAPLKDLLRRGIIHGDFQGLNVIVSEDFNVKWNSLTFLPKFASSSSLINQSQPSSKPETDACSNTAEALSNLKFCYKHLDMENIKRTFGLIDFEEISYSYLVFELGRAIADAMVTFLATTKSNGVSSEPLYSKYSINSDVFKLGGWMMCGYLNVNDLSQAEYDALLPAVLISLCQYYILGTQAMKENPSNSQYVGYCATEALVLLEWIIEKEPKDIYSIWKDTALAFTKKFTPQ